jgi:hypothetical protein
VTILLQVNAQTLAAGMERLAIGLPQSSRPRACDKVDVSRRRPSRECSAGERRASASAFPRARPARTARAPGHTARVIKQVAELTCPPGWFARPHTWPPYAEPESPAPG